MKHKNAHLNGEMWYFNTGTVVCLKQGNILL
jgi:hypothetical protein